MCSSEGIYAVGLSDSQNGCHFFIAYAPHICPRFIVLAQHACRTLDSRRKMLYDFKVTDNKFISLSMI